MSHDFLHFCTTGNNTTKEAPFNRVMMGCSLHFHIFKLNAVPLVYLFKRPSIAYIQENLSGRFNTDTAALEHNTIIPQVQKTLQ